MEDAHLYFSSSISDILVHKKFESLLDPDARNKIVEKSILRFNADN